MIFEIIYLATYLALSRLDRVRYVAMCFFMAQLVFIFCVDVFSIPDDLVYPLAGLVSLGLGHVIFKRHKDIAITCYAMCLLCIVGWDTHWSDGEPVIYNSLCAIITTIQILMILFRAQIDGVNRTINRVVAIFWRCAIFCMDDRLDNKQVNCVEKAEK